MTQTAKKIVPLSPGIAAAARCRPYLGKAQAAMLSACKKIGVEYAVLERQEKAVFRAELQISRTTAAAYASIANYSEAKREIIEEVTAGEPLLIGPSMTTWREIVLTDDKVLRSAAQKGLFTSGEHEVNKRTLIRFKKTGRLPAARRLPGKPLTALAKITQHLQLLDASLRSARGQAVRLRVLMEKEGVANLKGPPLKLLQTEVDVLLSELLEISPRLFDNVRRVLRRME